jgi:hypothetical protein
MSDLRRVSHLKNIDSIMLGITDKDLREVVVTFLKSAKFDLGARRGLSVELKRKSLQLDKTYKVYKDHKITRSMHLKLTNEGWVEYISAIFEIAEDTNFDFDRTVELLNDFMISINDFRLQNKLNNTRTRGAIVAILNMGGLEVKNVMINKNRIRIIRPISNDNYPTMNERASLAHITAERIGLVKPKKENKTLDSII